MKVSPATLSEKCGVTIFLNLRLLITKPESAAVSEAKSALIPVKACAGLSPKVCLYLTSKILPTSVTSSQLPTFKLISMTPPSHVS